VPGDDRHDHADRQDHHVGVPLEDARDVVGAQQLAAGQHPEQQDDRDQGAEDPVLAERCPACMSAESRG